MNKYFERDNNGNYQIRTAREKKKVFQNERSLSTLWESIKHINILILEFGGEEGWVKNKFNKIIFETS